MSQAKLNALLTISERSSQRGYNTGPNFEEKNDRGESEESKQCWGGDRRDGDKRRGQITGDLTELKEDTSK